MMRRLSIGAWIVAAVLAVTAARAEPRAQALTGLMANWHDLDTWSHYLDDTKENELGLGLQATGGGGTVLVAFLGRLSTRQPNVAPKEIAIQVASGERANPNIIRNATLTFFVDSATARQAVFDWSGRLLVDKPGAGSAPSNGIARVPAADFVRLADAMTVHATILGFEADLRPDQLRALRAFAERLHLPPA